jgi:hypothetical protein
MLQAYVINVSAVFSEACCKCMFQMFQTMLYMFYLNIAYVIVATHISFERMFQMFTCFRCMLQQVLHVASVYDVLEVDAGGPHGVARGVISRASSRARVSSRACASRQSRPTVVGVWTWVFVRTSRR